jgi:prophage regulatory protein
MMRHAERYKLMTNIILRERAVVEKVGFSNTTIRRLEKAGQFPKRIRLGPNMVGWRSGQIEEWVKSREQAEGGGS